MQKMFWTCLNQKTALIKFAELPLSNTWGKATPFTHFYPKYYEMGMRSKGGGGFSADVYWKN